MLAFGYRAIVAYVEISNTQSGELPKFFAQKRYIKMIFASGVKIRRPP